GWCAPFEESGAFRTMGLDTSASGKLQGLRIGSHGKTLKLYEGGFPDLLNDTDKHLVMQDIQELDQCCFPPQRGPGVEFVANSLRFVDLAKARNLRLRHCGGYRFARRKDNFSLPHPRGTRWRRDGGSVQGRGHPATPQRGAEIPTGQCLEGCTGFGALST